MKVMGMGIDYSTGRLLIEPMDEQDFGKRIGDSLAERGEEVRGLARSTTTAATFREVGRERTVDLGDPVAAGWTYLINGEDPNRDAIAQAIRPLAEHRGMVDPQDPLIFHGQPQDDWFDWMLENYSSLEIERVPHYILIVGGPDQVPFRFQSFLDSAASVGRVAFDSLSDLEAYVEKLIRLEQKTAPAVAHECFVFATDEGLEDPTHFSRRYMAEPLSERIASEGGFDVRAVMGGDATKEALAASLRGTHPALVFTASHGIAAPSEMLEIAKRVNGAICCHHAEGDPLQQWLFTADDVPSDEPFLEGAVFFQFACFGYGTPAESDYWHWLNERKLHADADFIAALPKRLLAHPKGPIAFIGHVDEAWLHGIVDPEAPEILDRWHSRVAPFVTCVDVLLRTQPAGLAMADMNKRYDLYNALLSSTFDRMKRGKVRLTEEFYVRLANAFITRSDAQNYMIFGDPAARLRIPEA
jgi:hypothetical protein